MDLIPTAFLHQIPGPDPVVAISWSLTPSLFVQQIVNGLTVGSVYALVALGYTMVYGIIRLINFAHGDVYAVGAFIGFSFLGSLGTFFPHASSWVVVPLAFLIPMTFVGILNVFIERLAYRPLRRAPRLSPLISALGVSIGIETAILIIPAWGASFQVFPTLAPVHVWVIHQVYVNSQQVLIFPVTMVLMVALYLFVQRTMLGKAMRAIAIDQDTSRLMGIDVDWVISLTFFLGGMLAAAAGVMAGSYYTSIDFEMGFLIGLKAFTAAVLGGIGNIPGAVLGAYVLGMLETLSVGSGLVPGEWRDVIVFVVLILVLVFRPTGILGERVVEKI